MPGVVNSARLTHRVPWLSVMSHAPSARDLFLLIAVAAKLLRKVATDNSRTNRLTADLILADEILWPSYVM